MTSGERQTSRKSSSDSSDWTFHNPTQSFVWKRKDSPNGHAIPVEIEELIVMPPTKGYSDISYDERDAANSFFHFKPKTGFNFLIKLKRTEENPSPVNSVKYITIQITYKDDLPASSYHGHPNYLYVTSFDFKAPNEILFEKVKITCTMTDFKKRIFGDSEFESKGKPKFTILIKVWSGKNFSSIAVPFKLNPNRGGVEGVPGVREVVLTNARHTTDADDSALRDGETIVLKDNNSAKRGASTSLSKSGSEKRRRVTGPSSTSGTTTTASFSTSALSSGPARNPMAGLITPYYVNYSSLRAVVDFEPQNESQRATQIVVTCEQNSKLKLLTDSGIDPISIEIFNPLIDNMQSKFLNCDGTEVTGVTPNWVPANSISSTVTVTGVFPFQLLTEGKFDVTFGDVSCVSVQKITPTQIVVLPPSLPPGTVEVCVFIANEHGERAQVPPASSNPRFTYTEEQLKSTPYNLFMNVDPLGVTRLHRACQKGDLETVIVCLTQKESPFQKDNFGWTAFHRACQGRQLGICKLLFLVTRGLIIEYPDYRGLSGLTLPAIDGDIEFVTSFWNWVRDVRHKSMLVSTPTVISMSAGSGTRPMLPPSQIPSALAPENEYRRCYTVACAIAEHFLPSCDGATVRLMAADDSPLLFSSLKGSNLPVINKQIKFLSPHRNVKAILVGTNHPHFSRKPSFPTYFGYSADLHKIQEVGSETKLIHRDPLDKSILIPSMSDLDIPPYDLMYNAHDIPVIYMCLYIDVFMEEAPEKYGVMRFEVPALYHVDKPVDELGELKSIKDSGNRAVIDLHNPIALIVNPTAYEQILQPYYDMLKLPEENAGENNGVVAARQ